MVQTVLTLNDLSPTAFIHKPETGKIHIRVYRDEYALNWRQVASPTFANVTDSPQRRSFVVQDGIGKIHLDFGVSRSLTGSTIIASLPPNAPTPAALIEVQTKGDGYVWITAGSRDVRAAGLSANTRYIVDLIGFFQ